MTRRRFKPFTGDLHEPITRQYFDRALGIFAKDEDWAQAKAKNEAERARVGEEIGRKLHLLMEHYEVKDHRLLPLVIAMAQQFVPGFEVVDVTPEQPFRTLTPPPMVAHTKSEAAYAAARTLWPDGRVPPSRVARAAEIVDFVRARFPEFSRERFSDSTIRDAVKRVQRETGTAKRQKATKTAKA